MFGIILVLTSKFFSEIGTSVGKYEVAHKKESIYALGFLNTFWAFIFLVGIVWFTDREFVFSIASLPTFGARAALESVLVFVSLNAVVKADRSTFSFLRILTIPLLLFIDIYLGYEISFMEMAGISLVVFALIFLLINHGLSRKGKLLSLLSAVMAVGTISLYKYNITHYNSVEGEQITMLFFVLVLLLVAGKVRMGENLFSYLRHKIFFFQSLASGVAGVFMSFAFLFAPASLITTAERGIEIVLSMLSGKKYFKEKGFAIKAISLVLIVFGIGLIAI